MQKYVKGVFLQKCVDGFFLQDYSRFTIEKREGIMMQDFTVGAQIDALIEDLEGAYDDLEASANRMDDLTDQLELAKKRVQEDAAKVAQLRARLEQRYPAIKGMAFDYAIATAKQYRGEAA